MGLNLRGALIVSITAFLLLVGVSGVEAQTTIILVDANSTQALTLSSPDELLPLTPTVRNWIKFQSALHLSTAVAGPRPADFTIEPRIIIKGGLSAPLSSIGPRPDLPAEEPPVVRIRLEGAAKIQRAALADTSADIDHDGIPNPVDVCPDLSEDLNEERDQDGCPDGVTPNPSSTLHQDPEDGATGVKASVVRVVDPVSGNAVALPLTSFRADVSYESTCVNILDIRELGFPMAASGIDNSSGLATFNGFDPEGQPAPIDTGHALTRLVGSSQLPCNITLKMVDITDPGGNSLAVEPADSVQTVLRGDARADGLVSIADALFIAQYLVGKLPACTETGALNCLHSVNAASVQHDGAFDQKTIADAMVIAQYLAGIRDETFLAVP